MRLRVRRQAGFTLVEMAIVLVIVGLIIAGVLTAQQVTQNGKITNAVQGIKSYQAAVQNYNQSYGAVPGDDVQAATRFPSDESLGGAQQGDGDGSIKGAYNDTKGEESARFWQHLRNAGLIKGAAGDASLPSNPFNGVYGVQSAAAFGLAAGTNMLCLDKIPGGAAAAIDQQLDDGKSDSGAVRGGTALGETAAAAYNRDGLYVMCTPL